MRVLIVIAIVISHTSIALSQTVTNFPITPSENSLRGLPKGFTTNVNGWITFPNQGYWVEEVTVESNVEQEEITIVLHIAQDPFHTYPSEETGTVFAHHFELPFDITGQLHEYLSYRQQLVDVYTDITPLHSTISNSLSIKTIPGEVNAGKVFRLSFQGEYPTAGYEILRHYAYFADGNIIMNMIVDEPEVGATVITPFEFQHWVNGIEPGEYPVVWNINGEMVHQSTIQVSDYDPPMSVFNEYGAYFNVTPITNAYRVYSSGIETPLLQRDTDI